MPECITNNLGARDQAVAAAYQYQLSLWPAFIGIIVAMGLDAAAIAYDNILWSLVLALTCGALPGLDRSSPPHQLETTSRAQAIDFCEAWAGNQSNSRTIPRYRRPHFLSGILQSASLLASYGLWASFVTYYIMTVYLAFSTSWVYPREYGAVWYLMAPLPALSEATRWLSCNNVDLYEPIAHNEDTESSPIQLSTAPVSTTQPFRHKTLLHSRYRLRRYSNGLLTWFRIIQLQLSSRPYRLHVRPFSDSCLIVSCFHAFYSYFVHIMRFGFFVWGSVVSGSLLFMPNGPASTLLVLLIFVTSMPRLFCPEFRKRARSGADLIVLELAI